MIVVSFMRAVLKMSGQVRLYKTDNQRNPWGILDI